MDIEMDRRTIFVLLFLVLVVLGAGITYYKSKHKKHKVKKIIKIPYKYNYSVEVLKPNEFAVIVNVTKPGNISQYLRLGLFCFSKIQHKMIMLPISNTSISLPLVYRTRNHGMVIYNEFKEAYLSQCSNYTLKLCDSFTGRCKIEEFKVGPWNYSINVSFPTNYTMYINITPTKVRFHVDLLRIVVIKSFLDPATGQIVKQIVGVKIIRPVGMNGPNKPNITTINFTWPYIGSYTANIIVFINETTSKHTIYHKKFTISPPSIYLGKNVELGNTNIVISPVIGSKLTFNKSITIEYKNGNRLLKTMFRCKYLSTTTYCPGAVKLEIINNGNTTYSVSIPPAAILCENSLGQTFPSRLGAYVYAYPGFTLYAGTTVDDYLVCYMLNNSLPYLMYFRIYVNGKIYEYNLILSTYSRATIYKYNYTIVPISPNMIQLYVNVSSIGTAPENLKVKEYCLLDNGTIVDLGESSGYSLESFVHNPSVKIPVYYGPYSETCKDVIFNVCDSYTGKCSNVTIPRSPWTYSVISSLLSNYKVKVIVTPIKQTLHQDILKLIVNMTKPNPYTGIKTTTTIKTITIVPKFLSYGEKHKSYVYTIQWPSIDSYIATINVKLVEITTHKIIYETNYTVAPKVINLGYTYYMGKNASIEPTNVLYPKNGWLNLTYKENGEKGALNLSCKQMGATTYCPVAIELSLSNVGSSSHTILIDSNRIFCITNFGNIYTKSVGTGIFGPISQTYAPSETDYGYLYCYIKEGSKLSKMYFQIRVDNKIYEYVLKA